MATIIKGMIDRHPKLQQMVEPGGTLHIRLLDLGIRRPFIFRIYNNVAFPMEYEIDESDQVSDARGNAIQYSKFYVEALYRNPDDNETIYYGEAWGKAGKLYLLEPGSRADFLLNGIFTSENHHGKLELEPDDMCALWLDVAGDLKKKLDDAPFDAFVFVKCLQKGSEVVLAARTIRGMEPREMPFALHLKKTEFPKTAQIGDKVYYELIMRSANRQLLFGGRASRKVQVDLGGTGLRLTATRNIEPGHPLLAEAAAYGF